MVSQLSSPQRFEKVSLRDQVSRALRAAIVSGELEPGEIYSAPALGSRFGVSATPVREAMLDLVRENLVETVPNKGYRVTEIKDEDLDHVTELRMLIEPPLAGQVTAHVPESDFPVLRAAAQLIVDGAEAGDLVAYTESDRQFHLKLLAYTGNPRVTALIAELRGQTRLFGLASLLERGELVDSAQEHHAILDAVEARDAERVESLMRDHIRQTRGRWAHPDHDQ
ncbi:GntR family transcriptional regulator [Demetria terragena]|uniref:GntR family transcriptional regulator n=1 Tax=Demetria terragena TaxID=63959 RepID=UPI00036959AA|nr:GntR family transcriptional regulator [Demetria terragena]